MHGMSERSYEAVAAKITHLDLPDNACSKRPSPRLRGSRKLIWVFATLQSKCVTGPNTGIWPQDYKAEVAEYNVRNGILIVDDTDLKKSIETINWIVRISGDSFGWLIVNEQCQSRGLAVQLHDEVLAFYPLFIPSSIDRHGTITTVIPDNFDGQLISIIFCCLYHF
ncbi:hypothetical protein IV203_002385 [Nitzschia inconspicua]|uniref:Uncharacterized protein n=1 Tax=Nitzschia inconspicua TaxID=303405 RepID=A0A9K3L8N7_9STRA|nr:hypothetical protein IV203_002385 [Nitzschia inconspicua]